MKILFLGYNDDHLKIIEEIQKTIPYNICEAEVFVCGYDDLGKLLIEKLLSMGARVRVGDFLTQRAPDFANDNITYIYTEKSESLKKMISPDEIVINTIPNLFQVNDENTTCKSRNIIDIDSYNSTYQKTKKYH
ncbi:MAG TPA: hypothetical protein GXZ95_03515 [Mollicutes bacterium]|nr:hypothetical protein [Mollicutes bacterium]